jgi:hypothetical protein
MTDETDLFGQGPAQGSLFGRGEDRLQAPRQHLLPDPETVRLRLKSLLEKAQSAEKMPWSERDARMGRPCSQTWQSGCRKMKPINCVSSSLKN